MYHLLRGSHESLFVRKQYTKRPEHNTQKDQNTGIYAKNPPHFSEFLRHRCI